MLSSKLRHPLDPGSLCGLLPRILEGVPEVHDQLRLVPDVAHIQEAAHGPLKVADRVHGLEPAPLQQFSHRHPGIQAGLAGHLVGARLLLVGQGKALARFEVRSELRRGSERCRQRDGGLRNDLLCATHDLGDGLCGAPQDLSKVLLAPPSGIKLTAEDASGRHGTGGNQAAGRRLLLSSVVVVDFHDDDDVVLVILLDPQEETELLVEANRVLPSHGV